VDPRGAPRVRAPRGGGRLDAPFDPAVFAFTLAVASAAGVLAGLAPALQATREAVASTLRGEAPALAGGERVLSLRGGLVLAQVALSVPLLVGAGLLVQSLRNIYAIDPGVAAGGVLLGTLNPSLNAYSPERIASYYREALSAIRALPGVRSASLASDSVLSGGWDQERVAVEGYTPREGERMNPNAALVTPDHFRTLGVPVVEGRDFAERDALGGPRVAIVNQTMARYFFGERSAVGRRMSTEANGAYEIEIVGVVRDAKYVDLRETTPRHFYVPVAQVPRLFELTLHVRVDGDPGDALSPVRAALAAVDPAVPLSAPGTLVAQLDRSLATERLVAWLSGVFGLLALLLAALGLYGVVAFSVARRTREIGVRVALGARGGDVVLLVLRRMGGVVVAGFVAGSLVALAGGRVLASLLYQVDARSPAVYLAAGALLLVVAGVATWLPARRAARIDPVVALRCE